MIVLKRDGSKQVFDTNRIITAVKFALKDANFQDDQFAASVAESVQQKLQGQEEVHIEEVQQHVENSLMKSKYKDCARAYIEYRCERDRARESRSQLSKEIQGLVKQTNTLLLNENANKDSKRIPTQRDLLAGIVSKHYSLEQYLPKDIAKAHKKGDIHYHDLDYSPFFPIFNCFSRDTAFITSTGVKTFADYNDGDIVVVPTHTGNWQRATVKCYGNQSLNEIEFSRVSGKKVVKATASHRWILKDGTETTSLSVGDVIVRTPKLDVFSTELMDDVCAKAWVKGFVFGDGNNVTVSNVDGSSVRICGNKKQYAHIFETAGYSVSYPPCYEGDGYCYMKAIVKDAIDPATSSLPEIRAFCQGFCAADAGHRNGVIQNIQATGSKSHAIIESLFDVAGLHIGSYQDLTLQETNYGKRTDDTKQYTITRPYSHQYWKVSNIKEDVIVEDVWCLEVENDHSFILQGGLVTGNCMLIDVGGMLKNGFRMGNAEIETPKSNSTACAITAQIIAQVASHIYGGNTINGIDVILAPYVRKSYDKHLAIGNEWFDSASIAEAYAKERTEKECYDAFQALEYEVNTLHTANGQTPFCTFGFGLGTSWEERLIQQSILKVRIAGIGKHRHTAVFPKLVFAIKKGVNFGITDPNYDIKQMALECATKRMYPDILNYDKLVEVTGSFKFPMGCPSFLGTWENEDGELVHDGRNNLGVVTLNLPRIALQSTSFDDFYKRLDKKLDLCKRALLTRIQRLETVQAKVAPILYTEGACGVRLKPDDYVIDIFKNGRASISLGYIGVHETISALYKNDDLFSEDSMQEEAHAIVQALRNAVEKWKEETGYGFSLYATPSENLCDRFCRLDSAEFGIVEGVTDKGYYTNSFHLSVEKKVNPFEKIDFECQYPNASSGGFISYVEFPSLVNNPAGLEAVWDYTYDKLPYFGTNTPVDKCHACGHSGESTATSKGFECPQCGNNDPAKLNCIRRVCGYLGEANARPFNPGKQNEVIRRVKHM